MVGVYYIINKVENKKYIGCSRNIEKRFSEHRKMLNEGSHHSYKLQKAWDKYKEDDFVFEKVEECEVNDLFVVEAKHIFKENSIKEGYNVAEPNVFIDVDGNIKSLNFINNKDFLCKPNFLIDINRCNLTLFQNKGINLLLYNIQDTVALHNKDFKSIDSILNHEFVLTSRQIEDLLGIEKGASTPASYIAKEIEKIIDINLKGFENIDYKIPNLLSKVKYDPLEMEIRYTITKDLFDFMYNKKGDFTRLDLREFRKYKLSKYGYALLEVLFRYSHFFTKGNYVEFTPLEFKKLVGASVDITNSYFKNKVLIKTLDELKEVVGITVDYSLDNSGKFNKIRTLRLHLNLDNPINKAFIYRQSTSANVITLKEVEVAHKHTATFEDSDLAFKPDESFEAYEQYKERERGEYVPTNERAKINEILNKRKRIFMSEEEQDMI